MHENLSSESRDEDELMESSLRADTNYASDTYQDSSKNEDQEPQAQHDLAVNPDSYTITLSQIEPSEEAYM